MNQDELKKAMEPPKTEEIVTRAVEMLEAMINKVVDVRLYERLAKANKQYFEFLLKEGFNREEALKIITSNNIFANKQ